MTSARRSPIVCYLGGTGRSGSTVVANVLGELPRCVSVGEVRFLWERGVDEDRVCGCGERFSACEFWRSVLAEAYGSDLPDAAAVRRELAAATRLRTLPSWLRARDTQARARRVPSLLAEVLPPLYSAIARVAGADVVVDSSKLPTYACLLDGLPGLDVRVLHLVRDPRAAAFSWLRLKVQPDRGVPGYMEQRNAAKSAGLWLVWNGALEAMWRHRSESYLRLAYEDFVADPRGSLRHAAALVDAGDGAAPLQAERTVRLGVSHTVAGNPDRLAHGVLTLCLDDEWRTAMNRYDRAVVTAATGPLLARYGYPVRVTRAPGAAAQ